jgi:hydroxyacylglutathione hydrolase
MIDGTTARIFGFIHCPRPARTYSLLDDGDVIAAGTTRVQAIATPGHTPGSMSFLVDGRLLFSGDTLVLRNGLANPFYCPLNMDMAALKRSVRKLAVLQGIDLLCTAHSGCTRDYGNAMRLWRREKGQ